MLLTGVLARWDNGAVVLLRVAKFRNSQTILTSATKLGVSKTTLTLTPAASLRVPKTTLRFNNLLERFIELRKVIILMVTVYYK